MHFFNSRICIVFYVLKECFFENRLYKVHVSQNNCTRSKNYKNKKSNIYDLVVRLDFFSFYSSVCLKQLTWSSEL